MSQSHKITPKSLAAQLQNVGPKMAEKMLDAGIDSPDKLKEMGAKNAYLAMYPAGDNYGDHNAAYLHALEGAIRGCDWQEIPQQIKQQYREFAQKLQDEKRS